MYFLKDLLKLFFLVTHLNRTHINSAHPYIPSDSLSTSSFTDQSGNSGVSSISRAKPHLTNRNTIAHIRSLDHSSLIGQPKTYKKLHFTSEIIFQNVKIMDSTPEPPVKPKRKNTKKQDPEGAGLQSAFCTDRIEHGSNWLKGQKLNIFLGECTACYSVTLTLTM